MVRSGCAIAIACGCYAPHPQPGAPCTDNICPSGLTCIAGTCELPGYVAGDAARDAPMPRPDAITFDAAVDAPGVQPQLVAQAQNHGIGLTSLSATIATHAGDLLVMTGASIRGALTSVSGGGATWTFATGSTVNTNVEIWYGVTNGTNNDVTITFAGATGDMWIVVSEWSGLASTSQLDGAISSSGLTSPADAGPINTVNATDLIIFAVADIQPNTFGVPAPGNWNQLMSINASGFQPTQAEWYRFVGATGMFDPRVTETGGNWDAAIAAFKVAP